MAGDGESRKRRRTRVSTSPSDGDEEKKRGRPRVEKQDESAADRRRTQIRMAQRAYRQRKESTLEDLRKRVSELTNCLELMNKAFTDFRDHMSATATEAQQTTLWDTSGQYEALMQAVRNPDEDSSQLEQVAQHLATAPSGDATEKASRRQQATNVPSWLDESVLSQPQNQTLPEHVGLGYTMYMDEGVANEQLDFSNIEDRNEAIAAKVQQQTVYDALTNLLPEDIRAPRSLPQITTYSFQETTFARRLHRACLEAAYYIMLEPARRHEKFEKVFKLSLMGKDPSKLTMSLKGVLARGVDESLDFWEAPLIHVGGAGTHYPRKDHLGNVQSRKSSYNLGLVGPQTLALLENAAKNNLSTDMTVEIAGYEGEWFDPYDVEGYLEERGIHIDPASSFVEAEIAEDLESATATSSMPSTPPLEPPSIEVAAPSTAGHTAMFDAGAVDTAKWDDFSSMNFTDVGYSDALTGDWMNFLEPGQGINWLENGTNHTQTSNWNGSGTTDLMQESLISVLDHSTFRPPYLQERPAARQATRKKSVIVDISKLVKGLTVGGVCLGRTPGYKRKDVDRALAMASFDV